MAIDGVDSSSSAAASVRHAQESQAAQQVGQQQAQQQTQATRAGTATTTQEVAASSQAARLERGAQTLAGSERAGGDPAQPPRTSQRLAQTTSGDVTRALERAEQARPSGTSPPGDAHLRSGDHRPAPGSEEARTRAQNPDRAAPRFDTAAERARAAAGLDHGRTEPVRVDARTGTETEHRGTGSNGRPAGTSYDAPHRTAGPSHESPHVGHSNGRGAANTSGNIPYEGPPGPARGAPSDPNTRVSEVERQWQQRQEQLQQRVTEAQRTPPHERTAEQRQVLSRAAMSRTMQLMRMFPAARSDR